MGDETINQVPTPTPTRLFSFMNPLAVEIWLFLLLAYVLVSLSMWVVARFTPYEWHHADGDQHRCHCNLHLHHPLHDDQLQQQQYHQQQQISICPATTPSIPCDSVIYHHDHQQYNQGEQEPMVTLARSNDFSLANSFWFTIGTLMQQGSDLNPKVFILVSFYLLPASRNIDFFRLLENVRHCVVVVGFCLQLFFHRQSV